MKFHKIFLDVLRKCLGFFWGSIFSLFQPSKLFFFRDHRVFGAWKRETHHLSVHLASQKATQMDSKKLPSLPFSWSYQNMLTYIHIYVYIDLLETPLTIEIQVMLKMVKVLATDFASQLSHGKKTSFPAVPRSFPLFEVFRTGGPHKEPHIPIWGTQPAECGQTWRERSNSWSPNLGTPNTHHGIFVRTLGRKVISGCRWGSIVTSWNILIEAIVGGWWFQLCKRIFLILQFGFNINILITKICFWTS